MADVFFKNDAQNLLKNKHIVFFGDSNARAIYKDLIWLLNENKLIDQNNLRKKQEPTFCGDRLGKHSELSRGREYEEERSYERGNIKTDFFFITRCYNPILVDMMEDIHLGLRDAPDVIYINSTLWDVSRWGPNGVVEFKDNILKLAKLFKSSLPTTTLVIWATALPVSSKVQGSLLIKQIGFLQHTLRFDVMEANQFARQIMVNHGFDVLDNHFYMRMQVHRRVHDGIHYFPTAIRLLTNLLLTHIALSWNRPLPNRVKTILLDKTKALCGGKARKKPPLPPHCLLGVAGNSGAKPKKQFNPHNEKNKIQNQTQKTKSYGRGRNTVYDRYFSNYREGKPATLQERFHQLRRIKGSERRNPNWRSEEPEMRWSETPTPPVNPWNPWVISPNTHTSNQNTNWSEDHWPVDEGQSFETNYNQGNSILARTQSLLARSMQPQRYPPFY